MKIVAGMGAIDDYIALVKAGADEVFCGYVPYEWNKRYGNLFPLNRREVLYYNIQINSLEDMKILKKMVDVYNVPVVITFNYLYYLEEQYAEIENIIKDLIHIGFNNFTIADIGLILYLNKNSIKASIHLSGECAEINSLSIEFFNKLKISRYIFHRKNSIEDMKSCIKNNKMKNIEYEAFILNEKCHYTGAFCNSLHCDELVHLCKIPYELSSINCNKLKEIHYKEDFCEENVDNYVVGSTGCGLCSLFDLKNAGVTHLKVVGRGKTIENMKRDIQVLKKAISMISLINESRDYQVLIKEELFSNKCSNECYYY